MSKKSRLLLITTAVLLSLILLAGSLDTLYLFPGERFNMGSRDTGGMSGEFVMAIIIFTLVFLLLLLIILVPTDIWRNFKGTAGILAFILLALLGLMRLAAIDTPAPPPEPEPMGTPSGEEELEPAPPLAGPGDLEVAPPPPLPTWASGLATLLIVLFWLATAVAALWYIWKKTAPDNDPLADLAREAQFALDSLQSGDALRDVIIRCYLEMGRVLSELRGIERQDAVTPREFERQLTGLGLPAAPVANLTRLFEDVRYGQRETSPAEQATAVASLEAIIAACQPQEDALSSALDSAQDSAQEDAQESDSHE
jgi:hypothetical protein